MLGKSRRLRVLQAGAAIAVLALLVGPGAGAAPASAPVAHKLSVAPLTRHFISNPQDAPAASREAFAEMRDLTQRAEAGGERRAAPKRAAAAASGPMRSQVFNKDTAGFPQNEESVTRCSSRPGVVLEGTNDYRGLLDPEENFTGWDFSTDGGRTVRREGLLPSLDFGGGRWSPPAATR